MGKYKSVIILLVLVVACIPSMFALLRPGFFETDDGGWMIIRFAAFYNSLIDIQFPVRLLEGINFGYGYPVANFLYPGFMYFASPLHFLGLSFVESVKVILAVSLVGSGIATYLWLRRIVDQVAAFVGALFYVYTPYHLYDVYKRGSVGEVLALFFAPLTFYFIERKNLGLVALSVFFLVLSHNTLALFFIPVLLMYIVFRKTAIKEPIASVLYGLAMTAFFTIPALYELSFTKFSTITIANPLEYFASFDLIGLSSVAALLVSLMAFLVVYKGRIRQAPYGGLFLFFLLLALVSIFLSLSVSEFVWRLIPSSFVQFPFRLLSLLLIGIAFVSAYAIFQLRSFVKIIVVVSFIAVLAFSSFSFLNPKITNNFPDEYYATNLATTTVQNEYMPKWVKEEPNSLPSQKVEYIKGNGVVELIESKSNKISFKAMGDNDAVVRVNTLYYPSWKAYVNNQLVNISYDNPRGVIDVPLNRENSTVILVFRETPIRIISDAITVVLLFGVILYIFRSLLKFK